MNTQTALKPLGKGRRFFHWWWEELHALCPAIRLCVAVDGEGVQLTRVRGRQILDRWRLDRERGDWRRSGSVTQAAPSPPPATLLLTPEQALHRSLWLPAATESSLEQVLTYEMDRLTPYATWQVYFDYRVTARRRSRGQIRVELLVAPRAWLDAVLQQLQTSGVCPRRVTLCRAGAEGLAPRGLPFNLMPLSRGMHRPSRDSLLSAFLSGSLVTLLLAWLFLPLYLQQKAVDALRPEIAGLQLQAAETRRLQDEIEQLQAQASFLAQRRSALPTALDLIHELTQILPDEAWLQQLEFSEQRVSLMGFATSTAQVVQALEASPLLSDVQFRSPVQPLPQGDGERYHLTAQVDPGLQP